MVLSPTGVVVFLRGTKGYSLYVLAVLMMIYLVNQMDRLLLGVVGKAIVKDLNFGDYVCVVNTSAELNDSCIRTYSKCVGFKSEENCTGDGSIPCKWDYSPVGIRYELLAGPAFTFIFTSAAIPLGLLASNKWVNRNMTIFFALVFWSGMTLAAAFTQQYWQLLLTRIGLGLFEAVCTPFASSIIADRFHRMQRGTALKFYYWGAYVGYSLAFSFTFVLEVLSWRWVFIIASIPGFTIAAVQFISVREPTRKEESPSYVAFTGGIEGGSVMKKLIRAYLKPPLLLLCIAGGIRLGAKETWAYNVKPFFNQLYCGTVNVGVYLSWVPLVGGTLGTLFGGILSERMARAASYKLKMWVLILSQVLAAPFLVGTIYAPPDPWAFLCLIPAYIIGETWLGICLTIAINMVPNEIIPASIAFFLFITHNISSVIPLLLPLFENHYGLQRAMLILFPGLYFVSAILFSLVMALLLITEQCRKRQQKKERTDRDTISAGRKRRRMTGMEKSPLIKEDPFDESSQSEFDESSDDLLKVEDEDSNHNFSSRALPIATPGAIPILISPPRSISFVGGGGARNTAYRTIQGDIASNIQLRPVVGGVRRRALTAQDAHLLVQSYGGF